MLLDSELAPLYEVKANLFKGLAHPLRIRILELLSTAQELSVADLLKEMELEASHLSQHLSVLRKHHLVVSQRRGTTVYYRVAHVQVKELLLAARGFLISVLEENSLQQEQSHLLPNLGSNEVQA